MPGQLLCELHAHATWSDGALTVPELVDLYSHSGFDVLAITDHVVRADDPARRTGSTVDHADPRRAAHALAIGLRRFVELDRGLEPALA
jgi:histidinol phosphatase-like PHP family hydrolase